MDKRTEELIAIGASVGAHCQPCLEYHIKAAQELNISPEEINQAIEIGHMIEKGAMSAMRKFSKSITDNLNAGTGNKKAAVSFKVLKVLKVYDPAMCCSSGVCGAEVDPALAEFAALLNAIDKSGEVKVERYNLSQQPKAFVDNHKVKDILSEGKTEVLPLIFVDNDLVFKSAYPSREELLKALGLSDAQIQAQADTGDSAGAGCCAGEGCC